MNDRPWETEPNSLDFEAEGLPCAMRRNHRGIWCGYVGVGPEHPLYGLPTNHPLKLPTDWFKGRGFDQGTGPVDMFIHMLSGAKSIDDACPINLAFHAHGGITFADYGETLPDGYWWFGFDCGHAGDYLPKMPPGMSEMMNDMIESMPAHARATMREIMDRQNRDTVYRDQQYVVGECQSLAVQLNAYAKLMEKVTHDQGHLD
jgi:hypothetical protein